MKQPFTIGGSVALKKALLEETGIEIEGGGPTPDWKYLSAALFLKSKFDETNKKEPTHYQLPQDWDKAVEAVKDFFAEEKFEKSKWYYANDRSITQSIFKFSHMDTDSSPMFSEAINLCDDKATYFTNQKTFRNLQPATTEQTQFMLGKVAEQKGLIGGAKIKSVHGSETTLRKGSPYSYLSGEDILICDGHTLYEKGKWAEPLPQEEAKPQTLVLKEVILSDVLSIGEDSTFEIKQYDRVDLHLTATHLQQLKAYFNS
jgi:hypothetical protein